MLNSYGCCDVRRHRRQRAAYARARLRTSVNRVLHLGLQQLLNSYGCRNMRRQPRRRARLPQSFGSCIYGCSMYSIRMATAPHAGSRGDAGCSHTRARTYLNRSRVASGVAVPTRTVWLPRHRHAQAAEVTRGPCTRARLLTSIDPVVHLRVQHLLTSYGCRDIDMRRLPKRRAARARASAHSPQSIACCVRGCSACSICMAAATCAGSWGDARLRHTHANSPLSIACCICGCST